MYEYNQFRGETYIVKPGDTKFGISKQFGITPEELVKHNNLETCVQVGQVLDVGPYNDKRLNGDYINYIVKVGDSIYSIARRYGTTVADIVKLNDLKTNLLDIGQSIKIPTPNDGSKPIVKASFIDYVVKPDDNLYKLARKYNLTVNQILKDNNLNTPILSVGQVIKIRLGTKTYDTIECYHNKNNMPESNFATYIVKPGDTLFKIAKNYNTTIDELMNMNNLSTPSLEVGQVIKITEL